MGMGMNVTAHNSCLRLFNSCLYDAIDLPIIIIRRRRIMVVMIMIIIIIIVVVVAAAVAVATVTAAEIPLDLPPAIITHRS